MAFICMAFLKNCAQYGVINHHSEPYTPVHVQNETAGSSTFVQEGLHSD